MGCIDLLGIADIETQEIDEFADGIDLGLKGGLAAGQHRARIHNVSVFRCKKFGSLQKDGSPFFPAEGLPHRLRRECRLDRQFHLSRPGLMVDGQHVAMIVRHDRLSQVPGFHRFPADDQRNLQLLARDFRQSLFQFCPLRGPRGIGIDRFIDRFRRIDYRVVHKIYHGIPLGFRYPCCSPDSDRFSPS
ncbi:MAG: hypothetical protein ACD_75C01115G0002 [uncultured bacterium]|nr:MAG: hypothetical protein ACD_75C01115G0002 [uncultured bacterium]